MANIYSQFVIDSITNISPMFDIIMGLAGFGGDKNFVKLVKSEIKRVVQMANRRIQNIKSNNLASPALKAVEAERGVSDRFSVFSIGGINDIERLKYEYGRAMSFLSNPTSTSRGARQYVKYTAQELGTTFEGANHIIDLATDPQVSETGYVNIMNYGSILDYMKDSLMKVQDDFKHNEEKFAEIIERVLESAMMMDMASNAMRGAGGLFGGVLNSFF